MGIGGGFVMTIWDASSKRAYALVAREWAPLDASENMFCGNGSLARSGGLSIGVPSEISGYWEAHQKFGKLPWKHLFSPAIAMCEDGVEVFKPLANALASKRRDIKHKPCMREVFWNPETNDVYKLGEKIRRPRLARTLRRIAEYGANEFYHGETARRMIQDLQEFGAILTQEDLAAYKPKWCDCFKVSLDALGLDIYTTPAPTSGPLLAFFMNVLCCFDLCKKDKAFSQRPLRERIQILHCTVEAFKHVYARRTRLGDPDFLGHDQDFKQMLSNLGSTICAERTKCLIIEGCSFDPDDYGADLYVPDDAGTAHVCVVAPNGDAVSVTSSINLYFGARIRSVRTGVIFNDSMDDFSSPLITNAFGIPPSPSNFICPKKRPISSKCPSIFVEKETGKVKLVIGGAGGTRITTAVAWVAMMHLMFKDSLTEATYCRRPHHQLVPMEVMVEKGFPEDLAYALENIGHSVTTVSGFASVVSIAGTSRGWNPVSDPRKHGQVDGF